MSEQSGCPSPESLLQALTEGDAARLDHVASCPRCGNDPELQAVLNTWRQLDTLLPVAVSDRFEAKLSARLAAAEMRHWRWNLIDGLFDWLHIPALAVLVGLMFWLPGQIQTLETVRLERPPQPADAPRRPADTGPTSSELLGRLQKIYLQRRNDG